MSRSRVRSFGRSLPFRAGGGHPAALPGEIRAARLANGLDVLLLENRQAPVVTSALCYRAGTRDEVAGRGGVAHFLEHMMFKGSAAFGPGEIDRRTQALGGSNNAFTSHDATVYYFNFAADRWREALAIEADRMAGLTLAPAEVASERQVILEEIQMYASDPWDSLEMAMHGQIFGDHPYGRPVLGTRAELLETEAGDLADFHGRWYRPANAVLAVAGDLDAEALAAVEAAFGHLGRAGDPAPERPLAQAPRYPDRLVRFERDKGEVPRVYLALPAPAADDPAHPAAKLLSVLLGGGRASRLNRALVDDGELCAWVSCDLSDQAQAGYFSITAEAMPGVERERVEAALFAELARLAGEPPREDEVERARRIALADWVFDHEKVHQQALAAAYAAALFGIDHVERHLEALVSLEAEALGAAAARWLAPERGGVLAWSQSSEAATENER